MNLSAGKGGQSDTNSFLRTSKAPVHHFLLAFRKAGKFRLWYGLLGGHESTVV